MKMKNRFMTIMGIVPGGILVIALSLVHVMA